MAIRPAILGEASALTDISYSSKKHWNYPDAYFDLWVDELTITTEYIQNNKVWVYEESDSPCAYVSLCSISAMTKYQNIQIPMGFLIDHTFVLPEYIGQGIGSKLIQHIKNYATKKQARLSVFADPFAVGFYFKHNFAKIGEIESSIPGRKVPFLIYK